MAAILMTAIQTWIGTAAERVALSTTGMRAGSTFEETDTGVVYKWSGAAWVAKNTNVDIKSYPALASTSDSILAIGTGGATEVTITRPANGDAYIANDVIGTSPATNLEFASVAAVAGQGIIITGAYLRIKVASVPAGMTTFKLHLFNAAPTAIADNAAFNIIDADRSKYLGYIALPAPVKMGDNILFSQVDNLNYVRKLGAASTTLYGVLATDAGYTPSSGAIKEVGLGVLGV